MCNEYKLTIYSIITGIVITLITGLIPNVFLLGVKYWGYFLPWLRLVLPGSLEVSWIYFLADMVIWSVFAYLTILSVEEEERKKRPVRKRRR
jgi:membrane protein implicated in regulation of membrane protease activity